ncbi:glycosyltransferase [Oculatella sp. LEGE 06141]|uniref:glycosyltransferase n=1 Tax=Oculatella sp. LEGE 06141 TaxID=1828648 RepID=UPI0018808E2A|nr:glycosyltransferase [Oculatella sp. LEGE 06141]MBE9178288.1 glycosyltransferase [Oculatella sp. LEGE 06141]
MPFPHHDLFWTETKSFLEQYAEPLAPILAPNEFMELFPGNYHYNVTYVLPPEHFDFVLFHKAMVEEIEPPFARGVLDRFRPVFANAVFVIYANPDRSLPEFPPLVDDHLEPLLQRLSAQALRQRSTARQRYAITITTHNRSQSLQRSLPQILALGAPVVIVDDASAAEHRLENQAIADRHQVPLIYIPDNRGLPNAINVGIDYWLADPTIDWISYFQDDVDVRPDTLDVLAQVQDPTERPLLTGKDATEHQNFGVADIAGHPVLLKRSMPGQHLHAHRDYWSAVLPIPTPYLGAPKPDKGKPGQGADEDWWITAWSPHSIVKRGGYVVCVPGLVSTFNPNADESTWGNVSVLPVVEETGAIAPPAPTAAPPQPSSKPDAALSLAGLRILVDGYNLEMTSGTGIKTYGTSLIKALKHMGGHVDVLLSRNSNEKNKILDEVLFFDDQTQGKSRILELLGLTKGMLRASSGPLYRARRRQAVGEFVIKQGRFSEDFLKYAESFNLPQCYKIAESLYKYFNKVSDVYLPEKVDIWHATYPIPVRIKGAKKITTVHDLIPLRLPYTTLDDKEHFFNKVRNALDDSTVVVTVSENSKRDILSYFDADPDQIVVTYQPIALEPFTAIEQEKTPEFLKRFNLNFRNYILFVGAIEPKKNIGRLLDAYATLDTDMPLVIVGKKAWSWENEISRLQYLFDKDSQGKVKLLEYVSTESLKHLYHGAYCFVFPSLYEGFGLPPLEALTFGCPVITSLTSCLPEVCGKAALYVDPYSVDDIKQKMTDLLNSPSLRDQLSNAGTEVVDYFSMDNYLKRLHGAYTKALG